MFSFHCKIHAAAFSYLLLIDFNRLISGFIQLEEQIFSKAH